jgi:hypothetical protein
LSVIVLQFFGKYMVFLIVSVLIIITTLVYFHRKHKNIMRRQCAYGCPKAYEILNNPNKYIQLKSLFETLTTPAERYFYSVSMSRNMHLTALERWMNDFPDSGDALLCYGARLVQWSWSARGYGRGNEVTEEAWQEFFRRLDKTREVLLKCSEKSPSDPTPWAYLIMVSTWYSDPIDTKYHYFNQAINRDPENWAAHMHMIIALSKKWGGCNEEMLEFARKASNEARAGSEVKSIVAKAYIENWKYLDMFEDNPQEANKFIADYQIRRDVIEAYNHSLGHEAFIESKTSIFARYNLSGWFWIVRDKARLNSELSALGHKIEDVHWTWVGTEGQLQEAWAFAHEQ